MAWASTPRARFPSSPMGKRIGWMCYSGSKPERNHPSDRSDACENLGALNEAVADSRLGEDVFGHRRIDIDLLAQIGHVDPNIMAVFGVPRSPDHLDIGRAS